MEFDVLIEIPRGTRNKYEVDHESGRIRLDRTLFTASDSAVPGRLRLRAGHRWARTAIRSTPWCSCMEPTFPGCLIRSRPIGIVPDDRREGRRRQVAVRARGRPSATEHLPDLHDLPRFDRLAIEHFFLIYKELEPAQELEGASRAGRPPREAEVEASRRCLRETPGPVGRYRPAPLRPERSLK